MKIQRSLLFGFFLSEIVKFGGGNSDDDCENAGGEKKPAEVSFFLPFGLFFKLRFLDKVERIQRSPFFFLI